MKFIGYLIVIIITVILQVSAIPNLSIAGVFPNLVLIGLLILLFSTKEKEALWWAGLGGLLLDVFSPLHYGVYTLLFLVIYFLFSFSRSHLLADFSPLVIIATFFVSSLIVDIVPFIYFSRDWIIMVGGAIYNTVTGIILYYLINEKLKSREQEWRT